MTYQVTFGSAFAVDKFGFVGKGKIGIGNDYIVLEGNQSWPTIAKLFIFLLITILPYVIFGFGLGFILALVLIHYYCTSPGEIIIAKLTITDLKQSGKSISFNGVASGGKKKRKARIKASSRKEADEITSALKSTSKANTH